MKFVAGTMEERCLTSMLTVLRIRWSLCDVGGGDSCEGWCGWLRSWWPYLDLPTRVSVGGGECRLDVLNFLLKVLLVAEVVCPFDECAGD